MLKEWFQGEVLDLFSGDSKAERRTIREKLITAGCWVGIALLLVIIYYPWAARAQADSHLVVTTDKVRGSWAGTVMLATSWRGGHAGVILNKPLKLTMAQLFPEHALSAAVKHPVHFGGSEFPKSILALVPAAKAPHERSIELAAGIYLVMDGATVDKIIAEQPNAARYFVGMVMWAPGELEQEVRDKLVVLRPVDKTRLFLPDTSKLYEQLAPPKKGMVES